MTTQTEQMEAFPRTTLELLEELAEVHRAELDKAMKALDALSDDEKIARLYERAEDRVTKARHLVTAIDQAVERDRKRLTTRGPDVARSVSQEAADIVNGGALDHDDVTVTASASPAKEQTSEEFLAACDARAQKSTPVVDPVTGEVGVEPLPGADGSTLDDPGPETPVPAVVIALYPGDDEPHVTKVGDRTRYSELVADYFTEAGLSAEVDADHWTVVARRELTQDGRGYRSLHDVIVADDYGQELLVAALEQGSVVGQADVQEANELLEDAVR